MVISVLVLEELHTDVVDVVLSSIVAPLLPPPTALIVPSSVIVIVVPSGLTLPAVVVVAIGISPVPPPPVASMRTVPSVKSVKVILEPAVNLFCFLASLAVRVVELTFLSKTVFIPPDVTGLLELAVGVVSKVSLSCLVLSPFFKSVVLAFVFNAEFILVISFFICVSS